MVLPAASGTYAIVLSSAGRGALRIGGRGEMQLHPGCYVYVGSAHGPGGLRARIGHHRRIAGRPRWHIDFLRARTAIQAIWFVAGGVKREHEWAERIAAIPGAAIPMPRFGSSDCRCASHLYYFAAVPPHTAFRRALGTAASLV